MPTCASCGAPIAWVKTTAGRMMPLDPERLTLRLAPKGEAMLVTDDGRIIRGALGEGPAPFGTDTGRTSHFATCPGAGNHRRPRSAA